MMRPVALAAFLVILTQAAVAFGAPVVWRFGTVIFGTGANTVQIQGGVTGTTPVISFQGSDTNVGGIFQLQGTNKFQFQNGTGTWFQVTGPTNASASWMECTAELAGAPPGCFSTTPNGTGDPGVTYLTTCATTNTPQVILGSEQGANWVQAQGPCVSASWLQITAAAPGGSVALTAGNSGNGVSIQVPVVAIASLPSCGAGQEGLVYAVNNGVNGATYNGAVGATGSTHTLVYCNGSGWTYH